MAYTIWTSELSPFGLKLQAMLRYAGIAYDNLPRDGTRWRNYRTIWLINRAKQTRSALRYPQTTDLDEYPLVPYLIEDGAHVYYDTSAIAHWLDDAPATGIGDAPPLFPEEPTLRFCAQLIDEAFDELGLYMVHHNRWVMSAKTNDAGKRLTRELARMLLPGMQSTYGRWFSRRQVRRLPYLFSVAPKGYRVEGLPAELTPPAREGFPPTHALLDEAWEAHISAIDAILAHQPYLLGDRFTVADAGAYGQLAMNLSDPTAADRLRQLSARTFDWLHAIHRGDHVGSHGPVRLSVKLSVLLDVLGRTFIPLMQQNEAAYEAARDSGETVFNEKAYDHGRSLYDGTLLGHPFRSVVKTFQVQVWRELKREWQKLEPAQKQELAAILGDGAGALQSLTDRQ